MLLQRRALGWRGVKSSRSGLRGVVSAPSSPLGLAGAGVGIGASADSDASFAMEGRLPLGEQEWGDKTDEKAHESPGELDTSSGRRLARLHTWSWTVMKTEGGMRRRMGESSREVLLALAVLSGLVAAGL